MNPAHPQDEESLQRRIDAWQHNRPAGQRRTFPGDPRQIEERRSGPAPLTPLGRQLLGLDPWP
jgi:hypothetical protein